MSKVITRSKHFVEIDDVEYEVRLEPDSGTDIEHRKLQDGRMVVGYLMQDGDCSNPLEDCDGIGDIRSLSSRHRNNISVEEAEALLESDPDVVPLSYFEHGQCLWDVVGGANISRCPDMRWDGVKFAGIWIPDASVRESYTGQDGKTRREWMVEQAASACSQYTSWCNGDCYGVVVVTCEADGSMIDSDECWGHIGHEYAEQTLKEQMEGVK